jgi:solute carrier family 25 (mitochondrial carnitine/acylcarnitine transporter), member 20/29
MSTSDSLGPFYPAVRSVIAGSIGGIGVCLLGHPLDTLKVHLQRQPQSITAAARSIYLCGGFKEFYRGMSSPLAGQIIFNAIQFTALEQSKTFLRDHWNTQYSYSPVSLAFTSGLITGIAVSLVECPIDLVKIQLQTRFHSFKQLQHSFSSSTTGNIAHISWWSTLRGIYRGLSATMIRNGPAVSFYFGSNELTKDWISQYWNINRNSTISLLCAGVVAGISYWLPFYPLDAIKSRIQLQEPVHPLTYSQACRLIWQSNGFRGFYSGLVPCLLRTAPTSAACLFLYQSTSDWMDQHRSSLPFLK